MTSSSQQPEAGPPEPLSSEGQPERNARLTGQHVGTGFITLYVLAMIGLWVAVLTPSSITLALRVAAIDPGGKAGSLALVTGTGALFALVATPVFGRLSDLSTSRWGQRRPYMLGGLLFGTASLVVIGLAPNILVVTIGWCLTQIGFNATLAAMMSLLPERVPEDRRGTTSGLMGVTNQVAQTTGSYLVLLTGTVGLAMFLVPAAVGFVLVLAFAVFLREVPKTRDELPDRSWKDLFYSFWINPVRYPDFGWAFLSRFLMHTAIALLTTYKTYFLIDRLGYTSAEAAGILAWSMLILAIGVMSGSVICGWWSDRVGRRRVFVAGAALTFGAGMAVIAFSHSLVGFALGVAVAGVGQGIYAGVDYALVAGVLPNSETEAAKGMGVFNMANSLPQTVGPMLAPALLMIGGGENYTTLYLGAAVFAASGAVVLRFMRLAR
ncbi:MULTISPECIES: MFS transporter [unclassified Actinopolyspora]|uniref:MFS transporter n=1 Tax=unclassified Actinopolyspora TaxID=2639451 RepID=UPI001154CC8C|nr:MULTISPECIES: MFS transporter [unclassified Actinopolyspora]NHD16079.1 MFS transporter [Actinopolyspora sp. BKK2]NHE74707.1 MFS transporter [Actinopolyspora sp. BKK1]